MVPRGWEAIDADLRAACDSARAHVPDLVLLQVRRSIDIHDIRRVRSTVGPDIEVVAATSAELLAPAIDAGASDFIALPTERKTIDARLSIVARRIEQHRAAVQRVERANNALHGARERARTAEERRLHWLTKTTQITRAHLAPALKHARALLQEEKSESKREQSLAVVCREVAAAGLLVGDVGYAIQVESGKESPLAIPFDAAEVLQKAAAQVEPEVTRKGNRLQVSNSTESLSIVGDAAKVHRALTLLLENANHFTVRGEIDLGFRVKDGWALFSVQDSGLGIDLAEQDAIFEPFQHGSHGQIGPGLGLTIVRILAEAMGGDVQVQSVAGRGSVFTLCLPLDASQRRD